MSQSMIDRQELHHFIDEKCDEIEAKGDWVERGILTAYQEGKLKALKGDTHALSLAEGIAYEIGNYLLFHASEFVASQQLKLMTTGRRKAKIVNDVELVWVNKSAVVGKVWTSNYIQKEGDTGD